MMARFPMLREKADAQASTLSGGQQKLLEVARGLLLDPKLMLIDEPSIGLSPLMVQEVFAILQRPARRGRHHPDDRAERQAPRSPSPITASCSSWARPASRTRADNILADPRIAQLFLGGGLAGRPAMSKRMLVGLIGANIQQSLSPALHEDAFAAAGMVGHYHLMDVDSLPGRSARRAAGRGAHRGLRRRQRHLPVQGGGDPAARRGVGRGRQIGAVNTVVFDRWPHHRPQYRPLGLPRAPSWRPSARDAVARQARRCSSAPAAPAARSPSR